MNRSTFVLVLLASALTFSGAWSVPSFGSADPVAIISATKGKVDVVRAGTKEAQRAAFGLSLGRGDRLAAGRGGAATIFFNDGNVVELAEGSAVTIGTHADKPGKPEIAGDVFAQVSTFVTGGSRQTGLVALSSMRGEETAALLLGPRKTSVLVAQPTFAWRRVAGATRYLVTVSTDSGKLWSREQQDTVLAYPADTAPLPLDADVLWEVDARSQTGTLRHESTFLHVAPAAAADSVRKRVATIEKSVGAQTAAAHFLCGSYLSASGYYQDAIERFTALCRVSPDSPGPHEALGRVYASVGLMDSATREYEQALELSRAP